MPDDRSEESVVAEERRNARSQVLAANRREDVGRDDVLDAPVARITAEVGRPQLQRLAGSPGADARGLPMQMVYPGVLLPAGPKVGYRP